MSYSSLKMTDWYLHFSPNQANEIVSHLKSEFYDAGPTLKSPRRRSPVTSS